MLENATKYIYEQITSAKCLHEKCFIKKNTNCKLVVTQQQRVNKSLQNLKCGAVTLG